MRRVDDDVCLGDDGRGSIHRLILLFLYSGASLDKGNVVLLSCGVRTGTKYLASQLLVFGMSQIKDVPSPESGSFQPQTGNYDSREFGITCVARMFCPRMI